MTRSPSPSRRRETTSSPRRPPRSLRGSRLRVRRSSSSAAAHSEQTRRRGNIFARQRRRVRASSSSATSLMPRHTNEHVRATITLAAATVAVATAMLPRQGHDNNNDNNNDNNSSSSDDDDSVTRHTRHADDAGRWPRVTSSYDVESLYSECELVNDAMQDYLFATDGSTSSRSDDTSATDGDSSSGNDSDAHRRRRHDVPPSQPMTVAPFMSRARQRTHDAPAHDARQRQPQRPRRRGHDATSPSPRRRRADDTTAQREHAARRGAPRLRSLLARGVDTRPCRRALTVVLDLDETLVYARQGPICVRPAVHALLDTCAALHCEVVVWTAGVAAYVDPLLRAIARVCGRATWFAHVISRHRCWYNNSSSSNNNTSSNNNSSSRCRRVRGRRSGTSSVARDGVKDICLLGRRVERVLVIENNPCAAAAQPQHAVLVEDYVRHDDRDATLRVLCDVVRHVVAHCCCDCDCAAHSTHNDGDDATTAATTPTAAVDATRAHRRVVDDGDSAPWRRRRKRRRTMQTDDGDATTATTTPPRRAMTVPEALACCTALLPLYFRAVDVQPSRTTAATTTTTAAHDDSDADGDDGHALWRRYYGLVYSPNNNSNNGNDNDNDAVRALTQRSYGCLHPCSAAHDTTH